jgi:4-hydroxy-2-oxoheptanedioate aldolase
MDLPRNAFKHALAEGRQQLGLWSQLSNGIAAEIIAGCGFDWVVLDMEHGPNDVASVIAQLQAMHGGSATAVVRPPWNEPVIIKRLLDSGAPALLLPFVQNREEAERAVASTRYPPAGIRGVASVTRASRYGRVPNYLANAASEICVLVQVETRTALDNLEAIASVPGVDGVFIGPSDLAAALGHLGNAAHPEVQAAIMDGLARLKRLGKPAGILTSVVADAQRYIDAGFTFVAVGTDVGLLARGGEALLRTFRKG